MVSRKRTSSNEIEDLVLASALQILEERGVEALTVRDIARHAGVAPMGIYNHFAGKLDVVDALVHQGHVQFAETLGRLVPCSPAEHRLIDSGLAYRHFAHDHPRLYQLMFMHSIPSYQPSVATAQAMARSIRVLIDDIEQLQLAGDIRAGDPLAIAQEVWSIVHGYVSLELFTLNFSSTPEETYRQLLDDMMAGLRAR